MCANLLPDWWSEGCTLDSADACVVDPVGSVDGSAHSIPMTIIFVYLCSNVRRTTPCMVE